jgi:hypothetical protein
VGAVVGIDLRQMEGAVGEHRVMPVGGKQLALSLGGGLRVESCDRCTINRPSVRWAGLEANAV